MVMGPATVVNLTGSSQIIQALPAVYGGFAVRETAGATAVIRVWDNASSASGLLLDEIALAANESAREKYPDGIRALSGIFVQIVSGTVVGSIRVS